jgi:hypothetical protein
MMHAHWGGGGEAGRFSSPSRRFLCLQFMTQGRAIYLMQLQQQEDVSLSIRSKSGAY